MAQHARLRQQHDPVGLWHVMGGQHIADPCRTAPSFGWPAMVGVMQ